MPMRQAMKRFWAYVEQHGLKDGLTGFRTDEAIAAVFPRTQRPGAAALMPMFEKHLSPAEPASERDSPYRKPKEALAVALGSEPRPLEVLVEDLCGMDLEEMRDDELAEVPPDSLLGQRLQAIELDSISFADDVRSVILAFSTPAKKPRAEPPSKPAPRTPRIEAAAEDADARVSTLSEALEAGFREVGAQAPEKSAQRLKRRPLRIFRQVVQEMIQALERKSVGPGSPQEKERLGHLLNQLREGLQGFDS
jgi:hypothetical protein